jgi:hypothetical protein
MGKLYRSAQQEAGASSPLTTTDNVVRAMLLQVESACQRVATVPGRPVMAANVGRHA